MGLSIISYLSQKDGAEIDRFEHASRTIPSWLACPEVTEVVVVDWGSDTSLYSAFKEWGWVDDRLKIVEINTSLPLSISKALNIAAQFTGKGVLCRLGIDHLLLRPDFFTDVKYGLAPNTFIAGLDYPLSVSLPPDSKHLQGIFYMPRDIFFGVAGYNEDLVGYCGEDNDLYRRLTLLGQKQRRFDMLNVYDKFITHIDHPRNRVAELKEDDWNEQNISSKHMWNNIENSMQKVKIIEGNETLTVCRLV